MGYTPSVFSRGGTLLPSASADACCIDAVVLSQACLVVQRRSTPALSPGSISSSNGSYGGGSVDTGVDGELYLLVLTSLEVYLIKRDFTTSGSAEWVVAAQHEITGVRALGYAPSAPQELSILLWSDDGVGEEDPNGALGSQWKLIFRSRGSIGKLAQSLSTLWRPFFGIDLPWHRLVPAE